MDAKDAEINMGSWNYRVINCGGYLTIHEVYYDNHGNPRAYTERPAYPSGETVAELQEDVRLYASALALPVLQAGNFNSTSDIGSH